MVSRFTDAVGRSQFDRLGEDIGKLVVESIDNRSVFRLQNNAAGAGIKRADIHVTGSLGQIDIGAGPCGHGIRTNDIRSNRGLGGSDRGVGRFQDQIVTPQVCGGAGGRVDNPDTTLNADLVTNNVVSRYDLTYPNVRLGAEINISGSGHVNLTARRHVDILAFKNEYPCDRCA